MTGVSSVDEGVALWHAYRCPRHGSTALQADTNRFNVHDRSAIDRLDWSEKHSSLGNSLYGDPVEPQRIGSIRGSCREDADQGTALVRARMDFKHIAPGLMQPRDDNDFVADDDAVERLHDGRLYLEPRVRRALGTLFGRVGARLQGRSDNADGIKPNGRRACFVCTSSHAVRYDAAGHPI